MAVELGRRAEADRISGVEHLHDGVSEAVARKPFR
jgi:hypothetical protein